MLGLPVFSPETVESEQPAEQTGQLADNIAVIDTLSVSAVRSVLIDADSGSVLYGNREYESAGMASTTKIMTALVTLNTLPLDKVITIPKEAVGIEGSSIYLVEAEKLTVEELLYGLLLASGNDCAVALALACCGSVCDFVDKMNKTVEEMGLTDTHFTNPHGLSDDEHYTSAYSLALITAQAMRNDTFKKIVSTRSACIPYDGVPKQRYLSNHNRLLYSYNGLIGVKTGFTKATGRCLVTAAERDGVLLVAVTLNDGNDWNSHRTMLDYGFSEYRSVMLAQRNEIKVSVPVAGGVSDFVTAHNTEEKKLLMKKDEQYDRRIICPRFLYAPVKPGDTVGYVEFFDKKGEVFYRMPLVANEQIEVKRLSLAEKIKEFFGR